MTGAYASNKSVSTDSPQSKWVFSHESVADGQEIIPYTVWGNNIKISIRVPTELRFHDLTHDSKPLSTARTSWVNYCFEDERGKQLVAVLCDCNAMLITSRLDNLPERADGKVPHIKRQNYKNHAPS